MKENVIRFSDVESCIIELRDQRVLLDRDVAMLYDVETKEINQAVKNNPDKFPAGYLDRKSTRLNSSHMSESRMPSSA